MKNSSVAQLALDFDSREPNDTESVGPSISSADTSGIPSAPLKLPDFGRYSPAYVATARIAGRINASAISEKEHESLLKERQILLDKKFNGRLSRKEANRLEYIRWSLDRIEDAKHGHALERLEGSVVQYERLLADLNLLKIQLENLRTKRRS